MRSEYFTDEIADKKFGIRFRRYTFSEEFLMCDPEIYNKWKIELSRICIQTDFHSKFKTVSKIGEGVNASVYKIQDIFSGNSFAVKQFDKAEISKDKLSKDSLKNEIVIMKQLNHPNCLKLIEIHETKNSVYFVLDL